MFFTQKKEYIMFVYRSLLSLHTIRPNVQIRYLSHLQRFTLSPCMPLVPWFIPGKQTCNTVTK